MYDILSDKARISFRLNTLDKLKLIKEAEEQGITLSKYVRKLVLMGMKNEE